MFITLNAICLNQNETILASGYDGLIILWDFETFN